MFLKCFLKKCESNSLLVGNIKQVNAGKEVSFKKKKNKGENLPVILEVNIELVFY